MDRFFKHYHYQTSKTLHLYFVAKFFDGWYPPQSLRRMKALHKKKNKNNKKKFWVGQDAARVQCSREPKTIPRCGGKRYKPCLFNLKMDPCEHKDLADTYPIIYQIMLEKLNDYRKRMVKPRRVQFRDPRSNPKKRNGVWEPWKIHPSKKPADGVFSLFQKFPYSLKCEFRKS